MYALSTRLHTSLAGFIPASFIATSLPKPALEPVTMDGSPNEVNVGVGEVRLGAFQGSLPNAHSSCVMWAL